jgi:hypothetical protein
MAMDQEKVRIATVAILLSAAYIAATCPCVVPPDGRLLSCHLKEFYILLGLSAGITYLNNT